MPTRGASIVTGAYQRDSKHMSCGVIGSVAQSRQVGEWREGLTTGLQRGRGRQHRQVLAVGG